MLTWCASQVQSQLFSLHSETGCHVGPVPFQQRDLQRHSETGCHVGPVLPYVNTYSPNPTTGAPGPASGAGLTDIQVAYGVIKRICRSVGLKDLELTFEEVRTNLGGSTSVRLVHLSIFLEYFRDAPKSQIYELEKAVRKNPFSYKILRDLVSEFLYLRNTDFRLSQEMGALFEIETSKPEYMLNKALGVGARGKED